MPLRERHGVSNERLIRVLTLMEARIEDPLTLGEMAESAGITPRQLERLFTDNLHDKPSRYYLKIRLSRAQNLLRQTSLPIAEVAMATGFVSISHFSRVYSKMFNRAPKRDRVRR
jgi:transcriptional regulator GlxA family with amidase domain